MVRSCGSSPAGPGSRERGPNCTPTVDGNLVYGITIDGDLLCAQVASGEEVWRKNFAKDFGGKMMSGWGYSESPLVDGNLLVCTPGAERAILAALDKRTGKVAWTTPMPYGGSHGQDGAGYSSIVISQAAGVKQYVTLVGRGVIGVAADTGRLLWRYERVDQRYRGHPHLHCQRRLRVLLQRLRRWRHGAAEVERRARWGERQRKSTTNPPTTCRTTTVA